ncbi:T-complex 1 subunit alpha [Gregarina niphandrodes]|uniref:T-complex 1 subunit alpha n=1 Tax=Gregarina niphandrodes TaxID=110365 RepID=A0A023B7C7_GRENI|nr:T-complex 1 subunit alpha [Gregarina niphandrodes]EZG67237.1 T-complex 1 subunit alpha [Gregarina niphandrodes]|eukprot:XP_011130282.1 T-complex 1 subunit alpha [Gregarina niphandrodes]
MSTAVPLSAFVAEREISSKTVRQQNVQAVTALGKIMASSLGPSGLDKMLVDNLGEMLVTNDGATILKQLEVQHPAAKVLVDLSDLQDQEVGDGTTSVILLAAELIRRGQILIEQGIHPTWILQAFKAAGKEAVRYVHANLSVPSTGLGEGVLKSIASTSLSSKLIGGDAPFFADLVCQLVPKVATVDPMTGKTRYPVKAISVLKTHGKSTKESFVVDGFALSHIGRAAQGMPMVVKDARIAVLEFPLKQYRAQMGVQILVTAADELEKIREMEKNITRDRVKKILDAGANVILTSEGIDDMTLKYFVEAGAFAVRRVPGADLQRIARATGAKPVLTMSSSDDDQESFDPAWLGRAEQVYEERVGDWDFVFIQNCAGGRAASLVLRGANDYLIDELDRCLHDAICVVAKTLESGAVCAGGGAVETALSVYLEDYARTMGSRSQAAIAEFAQALQVIPKTLAVNAAKDATDLLAQLKACHYKSQISDEHSDKQLKHFGLDLTQGTVRDNLAAGVVEPVLTKTKAIRFATEAAVTILRVDDIVRNMPTDTQQN